MITVKLFHIDEDGQRKYDQTVIVTKNMEIVTHDRRFINNGVGSLSAEQGS